MNFKRKNKTHRARVKKLDPCNNWKTPKMIQFLSSNKNSKVPEC